MLLNEIINGKNTNPSVDTLSKISEALEIPLDYFFDRGKNSGVVVIEKKIPDNIKKVENAMMKMSEKDQEKIIKILQLVYEDCI